VAAAFAAAHGLTVIDSHAGRRCVDIKGTASQLNTAFGITLNYYEGPVPAAFGGVAPGMQRYHGYDGPVHLPPELSGIVLAVIGLDDRPRGFPGLASGEPQGSTVSALPAPTIAQLYNFPNITGAQDQTIGVVTLSNKNQDTTTGIGLAGYFPNDIRLYFSNCQMYTIENNQLSLTFR
jgi:kumamolisin